MNEKTRLTDLLRDADPLKNDGEEMLSPVDAQRIRRQMLAAAEDAPRAVHRWTRPLAVAVAVVLMIVLGGVTEERRDEPQDPASVQPAAPAAQSDTDDRRQLQFSTPGGTRIIWIFDENLRLQEPMP
jgi:hypothetical protein